MITLQHPRIEKTISFSNTAPFNLIIENTDLLRKFLTGITLQIDDGEEFFRCYDGLEEKDVSKMIHFIYDCYACPIDEKKTEAFIQKDVSKHVTDEQKERLQSLLNEFERLIEETSYDYPIPMTIDSDISFPALFKAFSLSPIYEGENQVESFIIRVQIISYINKKRHFIFYNIHDFFTEDELLLLQRELQKAEIEFWALSSHRTKKKFSHEQLILVDEELFEHYIDCIDEND